MGTFCILSYKNKPNDETFALIPFDLAFSVQCPEH